MYLFTMFKLRLCEEYQNEITKFIIYLDDLIIFNLE